MMARLPTWVELRLQATNLIQTQKECNRSVHELLENAIPELDRKLLILNGNKVLELPKVSKQSSSSNTQQEEHSKPETSDKFTDQARPRLISKFNIDNKSKGNKILSDKFSGDTHSEEKITKASENKLEYTIIKRKTRPIQVTHDSEPERPRVRYLKSDLEGLEHLRPPPLTPSQYLRLNRPEMVENADRRVLHLRKSAERRKSITSSRANSALDQIGRGSRASSTKFTNGFDQFKKPNQSKGNHWSSNRSSMRSVFTRNSESSDCQAKSKLTEREMKRLTASVYNRLPEVKQQRTEEVTKHMRVQNYKNKLEYGRMLLANRRQGVINYPLKSNYEDCSTAGSQDSSLISSGERSSDGLRYESY